MSNLNKKIIAKFNLAERDLKQLVLNEILKNPDYATALEGKKIVIDAKYNVFKWDDPDSIASFDIYEIDN